MRQIIPPTSRFTRISLMILGFDVSDALTAKPITTTISVSNDSEDIDCSIGTVIGTSVA